MGAPFSPGSTKVIESSKNSALNPEVNKIDRKINMVKEEKTENQNERERIFTRSSSMKKKRFNKLLKASILRRISSIFTSSADANRINVKSKRKRKKKKKNKGAEKLKEKKTNNRELDREFPEVIGGRTSAILSQKQQSLLMKALPYRKRICYWQMIFGSEQDGLCLPRLYDYAANEDETLLIVRTVEGDIFGVFVTETWRKNGRSFYGTGESFLFSGKAVETCDGQSEDLNIYRWTGINECFLSTTEDHVSVGAGGNGFAFCFDSYFHGSSHPSDTFGNPTLISSKGSDHSFTVQSMELFCFPACRSHAEHHSDVANPAYKSLFNDSDQYKNLKETSVKRSLNCPDGKEHNQYSNTLQGADAKHMLSQFRHECAALGRHVLKSDTDNGNHCKRSSKLLEAFPEAEELLYKQMSNFSVSSRT